MKAQIRVWPSHQFRRRAIMGTATELSRRRFVQFRSFRCGIGGFTG
jgi:hypothetical protein